LRRSLQDYMSSTMFSPTVNMTLDQAASLWPGPRGTTAPTTVPGAAPGDIQEGGAAAPRVR
jgi:hypothetical protein